MKRILSKIKMPSLGSATELGDALFSKVTGTFDIVTGTFDTGVGVLRATWGSLPLLGGTATSKAYDHTKIDEKHYFLVPDKTAEQGFSLYVMRCLPAGVPPINELPKRRLLHLPNEHALPMLENIVVEQARAAAKSEPREGGFVTKNLISLMNEIDEVDDKAFNGVLLLGGLIALVNPLAGGAVAMKAMVPAVGLILSKYGLKIASETATNIDIANKIKRAEKDVKKQFKEANTISLINPLLFHLENAGNTSMWMMEREKFQFSCEEMEFSQADVKRLLELSEQAIGDVTNNAVPHDYYKKMSDIILFS